MKSMKVANEEARIEYGPEHIRVRITGFHGSPEQAIRLIDEISDAGRIHPIDKKSAKKMVGEWDAYREPMEKTSYTGTRISVDRM